MKIKSFLFGAITAGTITLLTTSKSGTERIEELQNYIARNKRNFQAVKTNFEETKYQDEYVQELAQTLIPEFIDSIKEDIDDFKFQIEPRLGRLNREITQLNQDLDELN